MKRYKVKKAGNQYQIIDTSLNLTIAWVDTKDAADRACKHINSSYETNLTKKS